MHLAWRIENGALRLDVPARESSQQTIDFEGVTPEDAVTDSDGSVWPALWFIEEHDPALYGDVFASPESGGRGWCR